MNIRPSEPPQLPDERLSGNTKIHERTVVSTTSNSPKITEGAVLVPPPENIAVLEQMGLPAKAKVIADLQMRSSSREIPDPLEHWEHPSNLKLKPEGWWVSENASFKGQTSAINSYKEVSASFETELSGATAAFCVTKDGRWLGLISPNRGNEASVWISTACARVQASAASSGKASALTISGDGYAQECGWGTPFEALIADLGAKFLREFDPARERCWIAEKKTARGWARFW